MDQNRKFGRKEKFWSKIEIIVKNGNFGQKSKFWSTIEILAKNGNFGEKSKFCSNVEIMVKIVILSKNQFLFQKFKHRSKQRNRV